MAIFLKNAPNDPRSLLETREHGSAKAGARTLVEGGQGSREEVDLHFSAWMHAMCNVGATCACCSCLQVCVASGRTIKDISKAVQCKTCKHFSLISHITGTEVCALCHSLLPSTAGVLPSSSSSRIFSDVW